MLFTYEAGLICRETVLSLSVFSRRDWYTRNKSFTLQKRSATIPPKGFGLSSALCFSLSQA